MLKTLVRFGGIYGLMLFLFGYTAHAQVFLARFVPGDYKSNNMHRVELTNGSARPADLSQWLLVTRDYVFVFPTGTMLQAGKNLNIAKLRSAEQDADISLFRHPNFKIKLSSDPKVEGNFCALLNAQKQMVDGFYHAELPNVPYLPDSDDVFIDNTPQKAFYKLPPENHPLWKFLPVGNDPAVGFERTGNTWRVTSSRKGSNPHAVTQFQDFFARYREGIVTLRWATAFEYGLKDLTIERSEDRTTFKAVGTVKTQNRRTITPSEYVFYDNELTPGKNYYYRLLYFDDRNLPAYSKVIYIEAVNVVQEFWMEALAGTGTVSLRFYSAYSQKVKIKLFDLQYHEVAILFDNTVYADAQNLLRLTEIPPSGTYLLIATTDTRRYVEKMNIP